MSKAWIEDLWLTEPRETLPDGSKVKIPVPSSVTKSLAAYMKTPEKAKVPGKFKTARYGHGKRWRVSWWATLPDGSKKRSSKAFSTRADAESFAAAMEDDIRSGRYVDPADADRPFQSVALEWLASKNNLRGRSYLRYENDMTRYVLPKWGDRPIGSIQESEVSEWVHELQSGTAPHEFKRKTTMQPMKRRTIKGVVKDAFGGVMAYALRLNGDGYCLTPLPTSNFPKMPKPTIGCSSLISRWRISLRPQRKLTSKTRWSPSCSSSSSHIQACGPTKPWLFASATLTSQGCVYR